MKTLLAFISTISLGVATIVQPEITFRSSGTIDSLGACQGAAFIQGKVYLYGDREVGMIRQFSVNNDSLNFDNREVKLTLNGKDLINHPTGIAWRPDMPVFIGNSIRLNTEGTLWKAVIHQVDWSGLQKTGTLDGNLISNIEDDACIQGTRPEYVRFKNKWFVATADYGDKKNEVRLYDPAALAKAARTSEKGVLYKKFDCGPWVQNLHWVDDKGILLLIQNQIEGRKWRFTFIDFEKSVEKGSAQIIRVIDIDKNDELEGFTFLGNLSNGLAVTSSRKNNAHVLVISW